MKNCKKCGAEFSKRYCQKCQNIASALWAKNNPVKIKKSNADWYVAHKETAAKNAAAWQSANPEKSKEIGRKSRATWVLRHPVEAKLLAKKSSARFDKAHPEKSNAKSAHRRSTKLLATPAWADEFVIGEAYALAALRTKMFGFAWHVDHIVPLNSKLVCGLHTHHNLQVIPGAVNVSKGNRYWPDMP